MILNNYQYLISFNKKPGSLFTSKRINEYNKERKK